MWFEADLVFLLAVSIGSSIDNFGVAAAYAMLGRRLSLAQNLFIGAVSGIFSLLGSTAAAFSAHFLSKSAAGTVSGIIFIGIGLWAVYDLIRDVRDVRSPVGLTETLALSIALSLNAGAAGFATELAHRPVVATAVGIASCSVLAMVLPQWTIKRVPALASPIVTQAIGAVALIAIGILQLS